MSETHPVALVTGAARRVGAVIARMLHAAGHDVALHYGRSRAELDELAADLESTRAHSTLVLQADLADGTQLPGLVDAVVARFGRMDALVNNASIFHATPLGDITAAQCDEFFAVNARAPLLLAQELLAGELTLALFLGDHRVLSSCVSYVDRYACVS